jgi:signal transduction histidine kinase
LLHRRHAATECEHPIVDSRAAVVLGLPLESQRGNLGLAQVGFREEREPAPDEVERLRIIADHIAVVVEAARREEEVEARNRELERANAALVELDRLKGDFLSMISHELRTPLTALQALLENLLDGVTDPDPQALESALAQTRRLSRLVQSLLDLSRLEAGEVPLHREQVDLAPFVAEVARGAGAADRVVADVAPGLSVSADPERLHQVLANLLDNALRHAPPASPVVVLGRPTADGVRLEVRDDGPGVPAPDRERVFERFARTDAARSGRAGGSGLGLAIVRWVVELHGGSVHLAEPEPPSSGCRVVVDLPRSAP